MIRKPDELWMKMTDKNSPFRFPRYYFAYAGWIGFVISMYLISQWFFLGILLAAGAVFFIVRLTWWAYRTVPFRWNIARTRAATRRWYRKERKKYLPYVHSPASRIAQAEAAAGQAAKHSRSRSRTP